MGALWLPSDDELVVAQREPNLLVPGRKPIRSTYIPDGSPELAQGLTAYWSFLPNLDNAFQSHIKSAGDREFTKDAYTWTTSDTVDSYDEIGHFAGMSAATGYAETGSDSAVRLSGTKATFYCWARLVHTTSTSLWAFGNIQTVSSNGYNWGVYVGGTNKDIVVFAKTSGGTSATSLSPSVVNWGDGRAHFVICVLDGTNCIIEVDGVHSNSTTQTSGSFTTSDFSIAFNRWLAQSAQGMNYYSAGVYPGRALTAPERQQLFSRRGVFLKNASANQSPLLISIPGGGGAYSLTADTGGFAATGTAAGLIASRKLAADSQSYALGGQSANLVRSFALLAESGDFTVSGGAASLLADRALTAALGAYSLSGIDAGLTYTPVGNYSITADAGAFALTGAGAAILADRALAADAQSYALTGIDAALTYTPSGAYSLAADSGSFALTGAAVTLTYTPAGSYSMPADSVAFGVTGHDAGLLADRVNTAEAGSFALTGVDAALAYGYSMPAESAPFALTGVDAGFGRTYQLTAELGEFTLTGVAATLRYSAAVTMSGRVQLERGTLRSIRSSRTLRT